MHDDSTSRAFGLLDLDGNAPTIAPPRSRRPAPLEPYGVMQEKLRRYKELMAQAKELAALRRDLRNVLVADADDVEPGALSVDLKSISYRYLTHGALRYLEGEVEADRIINSVPKTPGYRLLVQPAADVFTQPVATSPARHPPMHAWNARPFGLAFDDSGESEGSSEKNSSRVRQSSPQVASRK